MIGKHRGLIIPLNRYIDSLLHCKKDVIPLLTHWSYVFFALTRRYYAIMPFYFKNIPIWFINFRYSILFTFVCFVLFTVIFSLNMETISLRNMLQHIFTKQIWYNCKFARARLWFSTHTWYHPNRNTTWDFIFLYCGAMFIKCLSVGTLTLINFKPYFGWGPFLLSTCIISEQV